MAKTNVTGGPIQGPGGPISSGPSYESQLSGANRDAYVAIQRLFATYGLGSLASKIFDYVKNGYSGDTITILLQDTPEYKKRFAGNEVRKQKGLPVLSPAEYLSTEASYKQIMASAGLPIGFYDQPNDFNQWIGKNVSPSEIQSRVDLATQATILSNPSYRQALNQMGIGDSELTAYFLNPDRALPSLQKAAATAAIGAEALSKGLTFDQNYAELLATSGVSQSDAKQGYAQIANSQPGINDIAKMYGTTFSQREAEQATFQSQADVLQKQKRLVSSEQGQFEGRAGAAAGGFASAGGAR